MISYYDKYIFTHQKKFHFRPAGAAGNFPAGCRCSDLLVSRSKHQSTRTGGACICRSRFGFAPAVCRTKSFFPHNSYRQSHRIYTSQLNGGMFLLSAFYSIGVLFAFIEKKSDFSEIFQ
ncbi:MAG: hypothetical protein IKC05_03805 [Lentisphaeria bacterium]|nr:hypothetical protein [Lentisphaeria bacterium]